MQSFPSGFWNCDLCLCCSSLGSPGDSVIRELFCSEVENRSPCLCGIETVYSSLMLLFNMHYPDSQGESESTESMDICDCELLCLWNLNY